MIAIMDYGIGNLGSVKNALDSLNIASRITADAVDILAADRIILPGVGAFGDAMKSFVERGFDKVLSECIRQNKPVLGICVGMQLLFETSYEYGLHNGLGIFSGSIVKFDDSRFKVPHMGWNQIHTTSDNPLFRGIENAYVYFVHSYHVDQSEYTIAEAEYADMVFPCAVAKGNLFAVQFHPEKSGEVGLKILKNFGDL